MKTNVEIIQELNDQIKSLTKLYFENINSCMNMAPKDGDFYEVPGVGVGKVIINRLDSTHTIRKIVPSELQEVTFKRKAIHSLVRVEIPLDIVFSEWANNKTYLKASVMGIVQSVQRAWEIEFGSYKIERFGKSFFSMRDVVYLDNSDAIYLDFVGDWASSKEE